MNDTQDSVKWGIAFIIFILILAIGGFFLTKYLTNDEDDTSKNNINDKLNDEHKIDKSKDYIYFENEKIISSEPDITYKDVVINLDVAQSINTALKNEMNNIRNSVKYISDNDLDPEKEVLYDDENIYSALERNFEIYNYKEYISLVIKDYDFNCYDGSLFKKLRSYVFNTQTGKLLLTTDLLESYKTNMDNVKAKIKERLLSSQTIEEGIELIKVDETIAALNDSNNYALYIDKYGDLNISFIVKTTQVDYNENIKLN